MQMLLKILVVVFAVSFGLAPALAQQMSGELDVLPIQGTGPDSCGKYFFGKGGDDPDAPVMFVLKRREMTEPGGGKADVRGIFLMSKKNILVIQDERRKIPTAELKIVKGQSKVEVRLSAAERTKAKCLPKAGMPM